MVKETLLSPIEKTYYWTDSAFVLHWLQAAPQKWRLFVANRIATIHTHSSASQWGHVVSEQNPADAASRGVLPHELTELWWKGPEWLLTAEIVQPPIPVIPRSWKELKQIRCLWLLRRCPLFTQRSHSWIRSGAIGGWFRTIRVLSKIVFALHVRSFGARPTAADSYYHILRAEQLLVQMIQQEHYPEFFDYYKDKDPLKDHVAPAFMKSRKYRGFKGLRPLIINGVICAYTRVAEESAERYLPIIVPGPDDLIKAMIIEHYQTMVHARARVVIGALRYHYWIINGIPIAKSLISKCLICFRFNAKPLTQQMAMLPAARTSLIRPFLFTRVDFAGPFSLRNVTGRGGPYKVWISLFTCMATRVIHLEIVSSLSAEGFLLTFRRFFARRGKPTQMHSDNATNF